MKWIGQHIWDYISRFRNDVYLESISTGTIASGGNLGLDSNNKIVKATEASGDITGVTITTDSGGGSAASETSGSADFSILGSSGVGVTNSGTTITAVSVPGEIDHDSLLNFVANEHLRWDNDVSSTATIHANNIPTLNQDTTGSSASCTGQAATVATIAGLAPNTATTAAAQSNITSLGTLVSLLVDNIRLDDKTIMITGDTSDTFTITTGAGGATTLTTTDAGGAKGHFEIAADGNITLDAAGDIALEAAGDDITMEAAHITLESTAANDPTVTIQNTADDTNSPRLRFFKRREDGGALQVGEDGDGAGEILFNSYNDNSTPGGKNYAKIEGFIHDATTGEESGQLKLQVASHDSGVETGVLLTGGSADAEVDVTIGNGTASVTTIAGHLTITGNTFSFASSIGRRATFELAGYAVADGTNYMMADIMSGNKAPFLHDETSIGASGTTADNPAAFLRAAGTVMPYAGALKIWKGWGASNGTPTVDIAIFKYTPTADDATNASLVLVKNTQITGAGNDNLKAFSETSFSVTVAAGDILITAIKGSVNAKTAYFTSTVEIEWTS